MKKVLSVLALTLCAALLLAACGGAKLPEGMDQEAVDQAVEQSIRLLDAKDYAGLMDTMTDEMKAAADEAAWKEVWEPMAEKVGAFQSVEKTSYAVSNGLAVAVAKAKFEKGTITVTLSYDADYALAGLYLK